MHVMFKSLSSIALIDDTFSAVTTCRKFGEKKYLQIVIPGQSVIFNYIDYTYRFINPGLGLD